MSIKRTHRAKNVWWLLWKGYLALRFQCRECWERFPRHRLQRKPLVSDPGMHHGTCVTHVPWCMSGSLTRGGGENVPGIPGACATSNFAYLVRGPWPFFPATTLRYRENLFAELDRYKVHEVHVVSTVDVWLKIHTVKYETHQITTLKCFSSRIVVAFVQVENEDVLFGAAPTAMPQLHLSDQQFHCLLWCVLYYGFVGIYISPATYIYIYKSVL